MGLPFKVGTHVDTQALLCIGFGNRVGSYNINTLEVTGRGEEVANTNWDLVERYSLSQSRSCPLTAPASSLWITLS